MTGHADCAGVGVGYFACDVIGGCRDCRHLAYEICDFEQFWAWGDEAEKQNDVAMASERRRIARSLARNAGG